MTVDASQYSALCQPSERVLRQLLLDFDFFCEDIPGLVIFSVDHRIKTYGSAVAKSQSQGIPIEEMQDLAGVRIVVGTDQSRDVVRRFFTRQEISKDLVVEKDEPVQRKSGYRSHHLVVRYPPRYTRSRYAARIEVQLPTIFQHAFNLLSRTWAYKSERSFTADWRNRFTSVAARLDELNSLAARLHDDVVASAASHEPAAPVSPFSYQLLVHAEFGEVETLDHSVDAVRRLADFGITTNGLLLRYLRDPSLVQAWLEFTAYARRGDSLAQEITARRVNFWSLFGLTIPDVLVDQRARILRQHPDWAVEPQSDPGLEPRAAEEVDDGRARSRADAEAERDPVGD